MVFRFFWGGFLYFFKTKELFIQWLAFALMSHQKGA